MLVKRHLFVIGLLLLPVLVEAQSIKLNTLEEALEQVLARNTDYENYQLNKRQAELEYKQSRAYRKPQVSGSFNGQRNLDLATTPLPGEIVGQPGETVEAQFGTEYNYNVGLTISKDLFDRENKLKARMAGLQAKQVGVEQETFEQLLREQVTLYYYTALVAKRAVVLGESDRESAEQLSALSKQRFEEGVVDAFTVNNARINALNVRQNLTANQQLFDQCEIALKKLLAMSPADSLILTEGFTYGIPDAVVNNQLQPDQALKSAEVKLEQADLQLQLSRAALLPTISTTSYYGRQQFRDDFGMGFGSDNWSNYSYLNLSVVVPIFSGFSKRYGIRHSKLGQELATNELQDQERAAALDDALLLRDYQHSLETAQQALSMYELYEANRKLAEERQLAGLTGLDTYLTTFEDYLRAENAYLNAMAQVYTYYSQIIPRLRS